MNTKIITTAAVSAFIFFGVGTYVGLKQTSDAPSPPPKNPRNSQIIASLRQDNQSLKAEVAQLKADIEQLDKVNGQLAAQIAAPPPPHPPRSETE